MSSTSLRCVLLSTTLDLRGYLAQEMAKLDGKVTFVDHLDDSDPADVQMAIGWHPPADAFDHYPNLKAVCSIAAGADSLLHCPSMRDGIDIVRVVEPAQAEMMSGFVAWHAISHQRQMGVYRQQQRDKVWRRQPQRSAADVPVGILGYGAMGARVASDLTTLGFPVKVWSRTAKPTTSGVLGFSGADGLDRMLDDTEVLVNLLPLTTETRGILSASLFAKLRRGAYLIHVGRGPHMVDADVFAALDSGQLSGAAIDVFPVEPLPTDSPFWTHPKIVLTPHDACDASMTAIGKTIRATAESVQAGFKPKDTVDRARGY
jgi:glyoxylate/hydroxypyruvate reductase A